MRRSRTRNDFSLPDGDVIDVFNGAFTGTKPGYNSLKNLLQGYNEQGCPLNRFRSRLQHD